MLKAMPWNSKFSRVGGMVILHLLRECCWAACDLKFCATAEILFATPV